MIFGIPLAQLPGRLILLVFLYYMQKLSREVLSFFRELII